MRPRQHRRSFAVLLACALGTSAGVPACTSDPIQGIDEEMLEGRDFEAIARPTTAEESTRRSRALAAAGAPVKSAGSGDSFYLAIKESALDDRWFLSAYLEQYFPGAIFGGAASTLGTRVVSFRLQNDKLFVFDVDDRTASSDVFDPDLVIDAFPVVDVCDYRTPSGRARYVVIDPAAGQNRFTLVSDAFGQREAARLEVELAFSQSFRATDDGATWENVFAAYAQAPLDRADEGGGLERNPFKASGTLGMSLRKYREGSGYEEMVLPPYGDDLTHEHYFRSEPRLVRNTGEREELAAHWDIHRGMQPIEWLISPELARLDDTPRFKDFDLVKAVKAGVEGWNKAFGFKGFTARVARAGEEFWQDDRNYIVFDPSPEAGFAFADWRSNPNTGETRGASVYFGSIWLTPEDFENDFAETLDMPQRPTVRRIEWEGVSSPPLCVMPRHAPRTPGSNERTAKEKFERSLSSLILHEVGHTLGLRHNFKGSLAPPGTSVMDYSTAEDTIAIGATPAAYDLAAVRYLYGLSTTQPPQAFCPDELVGVDPDCQPFDAGAEPLEDFHRAEYASVVAAFTSGRDLPVDVLDVFAAGLVAYAQTGDASQAPTAWRYAVAGIAAPLAAANRTPTYAAGANTVMRWLLARCAAQHHPSIASRVIEQAGLVARNVDTVRPPDMRRDMVDLLKRLQTPAGYQALLTLRTDLAAQLAGGSLSGDEALVVQDLVARVDRAVNPYFD